MSVPATESDLLRLADNRAIPEEGLARNNPITAMLRGAYSFPHDWWLAIHWSLGLRGAYGGHMQNKCRQVADQMDVLLWTVRNGAEPTYKAVAAVVNYVLSNELTRCAAMDLALKRIDKGKAFQGTANTAGAIAGRIAGGAFTHFAATGGRYGAVLRNSPAKPGILASNFVLASAGAVVRLAIKTKGVRASAADLALAILAGSDGQLIRDTVWADIIRAVQICALKANAGDHSAFDKLFREIAGFRSQAAVAAP